MILFSIKTDARAFSKGDSFMNSQKLIIVLFLCSLFFFSCSTLEAESYASFYWIKEGKVYYLSGGHFENGEPKIADIAD